MMDRVKKDQRSPLMRAQAMAPTGGVVNFCPFGCTDEELDQHGYCKHLIGFTNDKKTYEPMIWDGVRQSRIVRVKMVQDKDGKPIPQLEPCQKGDKFVQVSVSSRVYRNTEATPELLDVKPSKAK
jgi:hypothetical protein